MNLKRRGNAILNTDDEGYLSAKKRLAYQKERKEKDRLLLQLNNRVRSLEEEVKKLRYMIEEMKDDIS